MTSPAVELDDSFEGVAATFSYSHGWVDESRTQRGFAHLTEHLVGDRLRRSLADWHQQVSDGDYTVEAHSYPFHTEFTVHLVSDLAPAVTDGFRRALRSLHAADGFDVDEITRQRRIIDREAALRRTRGARATWPWAYSRSIITGDPDAHDSFGPTDELERHATTRAMDQWATLLRRSPAALGIAAHPDDRTLVHRLVSLAESEPERASASHQAPECPRPRDHGPGGGRVCQAADVDSAEASRPTRPCWATERRLPPRARPCAPANAAVTVTYVPPPPGTDPSAVRGMTALLAAAHHGPRADVSVSAGSFGPYQGPDYGYLYRQPAQMPGWRWDAAAVRDGISTARKREVDTLRSLAGRQPDAARLLSRDALFGLDARATERTIRNVGWPEIREFVAHVDHSPAITFSVSFDSTGGMRQWLTSS